MRISDRYIALSILSGTLFAIVLLSALLVLGNLFKEIRPLLVEVGAPIWVLWDFILGVLPVSLIFTVPWAFLSAVLLVFGRMSSENELNAFRAAGVSLTRLAAPVVVIGAALSAMCLWLNLQVAPQAKLRVENIVTETIIKDPRSLLRAGVDQSRIRNVRIDSGRSQGDVFHNFHIFGMDESDASGVAGVYIHADTAETVVDLEKKQIRLKLGGVFFDAPKGEEKDQMALSEDVEWMLIDYSEDQRRKPKPSAMTNDQIDFFLDSRPNLPEKYRARFRAEQQRRYTSSFACLAFAMIGIPLGIRARRRDTSSGLVISLAIGALYFFAGSLMESSSEDGQWILWLPNFACLTLGLILFRRARFR